MENIVSQDKESYLINKNVVWWPMQIMPWLSPLGFRR